MFQYAWTAFSCSLVYSTVTYIIMTMLVGWRGWSILCLHPSTLCIEMRPGTSTSMSILSITSKMSRMQLPLEKSFRVSLCDQAKKKFRWDPKMPWKSIFEVSQPVQAVQLYIQHCLGNFKHTFPGHFGVPPNNFLGDFSQRLTLKNFTKGSCIHDKLSP